MGVVKQINIKNQTYYFHNDMINIKNSDPILLKLTENHTKILLFITMDILQLKKIDDWETIYSVNPLHLLVNHANGYIEEKGVNKYLIFDSTDENKELLRKYNNVWNRIKDKIKEVSSGECDYEK